jgi:hypothetical protein
LGLKWKDECKVDQIHHDLVTAIEEASHDNLSTRGANRMGVGCNNDMNTRIGGALDSITYHRLNNKMKTLLVPNLHVILQLSFPLLVITTLLFVDTSFGRT